MDDYLGEVGPEETSTLRGGQDLQKKANLNLSRALFTRAVLMMIELLRSNTLISSFTFMAMVILEHIFIITMLLINSMGTSNQNASATAPNDSFHLISLDGQSSQVYAAAVTIFTLHIVMASITIAQFVRQKYDLQIV